MPTPTERDLTMMLKRLLAMDEESEAIAVALNFAPNGIGHDVLLTIDGQEFAGSIIAKGGDSLDYWVDRELCAPLFVLLESDLKHIAEWVIFEMRNPQPGDEHVSETF